MKDIFLPQLFHAPERTETVVFDEMVPGFTSLVPVRGKLIVKHGGTFLDLLLEADTIVTFNLRSLFTALQSATNTEYLRINLAR